MDWERNRGVMKLVPGGLPFKELFNLLCGREITQSGSCDKLHPQKFSPNLT